MGIRQRLSIRFCLRLLLVALFCAQAQASSVKRIEDKEISALPSSAPVVLLNFWATWCKPCQSEIPSFNKLHRKYPAVRFIGINVDDIENAGAIPGFLKKHPFDYPVTMREGTNFKSMAESIDPKWQGGLPATFVFLHGKRVFSKLGMIDEKELDAILQQTVKGL